MSGFLPTTKKELREAGICQPDFIMVTGDAYVDHPSFAHALISRYLVANGYSVGIIAQPNWKDARSFARMGRPRLGFLISAGNMDSMVNIYTVTKKKREKDMYSPGGKAGRRPARTTTVYAKKIRETYRNVPIIIGGIEASLRRFAHYDYWDDTVMQSVLTESRADLLVYGMGERAILEIAEALDGGIGVRDITYVEGTAYRADDLSKVYDCAQMPSFEQVKADKRLYAEAFMTQMNERKSVLAQKNGDEYVVQNIPAKPLSQAELDAVYALPFARKAHPIYDKPVPALEEVEFSIAATRGCIGACSFCALYYHQGKDVIYRSKKSILNEARGLIKSPDFKGYIHDVGGPTANLYGMKCKNKNGPCTKRRCLVPRPCKNLMENHAAYVDVLKSLRELSGVKKVFIRSGIRHDFALLDKSGTFVKEVARHHVSGQLKLAPEHVCGSVLGFMGKPEIDAYEKFLQKFDAISKSMGKKQYVLPYFMSSHPGCSIDDAVALAEYIRDSGFMPDTAQDFYPTPGTLSTCMYYTGIDPVTGKKVYTAKSPDEKAMQRALIQYRKPVNRQLVLRALKKAGREDLIRGGKKALLRG